MNIIRYRNIFFALGGILIILSLVGIFVKGFDWGVDFTGGSVLQVEYQSAPNVPAVSEKVRGIDPEARVQSFGENGLVVRTKPLSLDEKNVIMEQLVVENNPVSEKKFNTVGPTVGKDLRSRSIIAIVLVALAIIAFIAFAFRKVSKPLSSWTYGLVAVVVLIHDVLIPAGVFAWLQIPVDTLFVVGLLTILGISVNDTIVVFDRIRENLSKAGKEVHGMEFATVVGKSIRETFTRSIMTSFTVLLALLALWIFGPDSTKTLALSMFLGMFFGTYSSIFLASPLLVVINNWREGKKK